MTLDEARQFKTPKGTPYSELPDDVLTGIHEGKYKDTSPEARQAAFLEMESRRTQAASNVTLAEVAADVRALRAEFAGKLAELVQAIKQTAVVAQAFQQPAAPVAQTGGGAGGTFNITKIVIDPSDDKKMCSIQFWGTGKYAEVTNKYSPQKWAQIFGWPEDEFKKMQKRTGNWLVTYVNSSKISEKSGKPYKDVVSVRPD